LRGISPAEGLWASSWGRKRARRSSLHKPDRETPIGETLSAIAELHAEGKIKDLGVSNFSSWQTLDAMNTAVEIGTPGPVVAQQLYNLIARRIEDEFLEFARMHHLLIMVFNPLAGGLLVAPPPADAASAPARFPTSWLAAAYRERYWTPQILNAVRELARVADEAGIGMPELSLRWLVARRPSALSFSVATASNTSSRI
jgi:aryl-alcohol dehydrogenase-like predicted oxidoreductase